jgi:hypothetical protein
VRLRLAKADDVAALVSLRTAVNQHLISQFGTGYWAPSAVTGKGVLFGMRRANVYVAGDRDKLIATLALSTTKPWAIDKRYFSRSNHPLYGGKS